ncbi:GmrSD restriction endonuclease domain-containing protein [Porphyromonas sp.]
MIQELRILDDETLFDKEVHYVIPRYQRAYAWEDKEIVQLIDDINDSTGDYYIGSLVVAKVKGREERYEVVDGQQRLTTLYLLLHYLFSHDGQVGEIGKTLSFDCRPNSNYTLEHIQDLLSDAKSLVGDEDRLEQSILNGLKAIDQKFMLGAIDVDAFVERLKMVILYRIEVPEHTDLNRYFEIMNTRGEQLEQHDILKAKLMGYLPNRKEQEFFSRVWSACSDMTGYVQMHFAKAEREVIFRREWNGMPSDKWTNFKACLNMGQSADKEFSITSVMRSDFKVAALDGVRESDNAPIRFDSIIGFPHFLLHVLRVFLSVGGVSLGEEGSLGRLLDDKRLLTDYNKVIACGQMGGKPIKENKASFARKFILFLLRSRFLFDQFIIKRESIGDDQDGRWSLKELCTSGAWSAKKPYYANTRLRYENEWEKTYAPRNKECLMIQSALRVSYISPKVMHWITELLVWLFNNNETERYKLTDEAERIAAEAVKENFLDLGNYERGVQTPHVVFNYLDYLLWKDDKERYEDFVFEFRNSVEHWYPQHPSDGTIEPWDGRDVFGNLCIISRSVNSKFSNLSPESKMKSYKKMVQKGSLKLRIMGDIIEGGNSETWRLSECAKHEEEMISLLCEAVQEAIEEE